MTKYDIGFVLEQALGHITHTKNLQSHVSGDAEVNPHWALIDFDSEGLAARIPIYRSNWSVRAGVRANRQLSSLTRHARLDVLFFHTQVPAILAQRWMYRIPSVISLDATPVQYDQLGQYYRHKSGPSSLEWIKKRLNRSAYVAARHIVVWADWTKRSLVRDYDVPDDKITVIPPGVTVADWVRPAPRQSPGGTVKILFVGGDFERKGGKLLLEAFRALMPLEAELHIVTKDPIGAEDNVFVYRDLKPNSAELKQLYHSCDIFALPTYADCLPMVLSEAAAAELAIVSTNIAGIPEIVQRGRTGLTISPGDTRALVEALRALVQKPELRLELASQARNHVAEAYDAQTNTRRLLTLLKSEVRNQLS